MKINKVFSSFRDPDGFVFFQNGHLFRQINPGYKNNYDLLIKSGLYAKLVKLKLLISHKETKTMTSANSYKIIEPTPIPFISYPFEWCFSELKDAALLTLRVQKIALAHGMTLKDATTYNVQFFQGKPIFIDTLSFKKYEEGKPWVAYKQFCEQFLAPLALSAYKDVRLLKLLRIYTDGIPLELVSKLLPFSAKIRPGILFHIYLHSKSQLKFADESHLSQQTVGNFNKNALWELLESLEGCVQSLNWKPSKTLWSNYYDKASCVSYKNESLVQKKKIVSKYLDLAKPKSLWDIGANSGLFSRISSKKGIYTISMDSDYSVIEQNYLKVKKGNEKNILPLQIDVSNPTPSLGWENKEYISILSRRKPDTIMALALIHHLAIGGNIPLSQLAHFFAKRCTSLIIEFVPKEDDRVRMLLRNRKDIFTNYDQINFESEFAKYFNIMEKSSITGSTRTLYLMNNRNK